MLAGCIVGPEADATKEEGPRDRLAGIRVTTSQRIVVIEHGALKLNVLPQKRQGLGFAHLLLVALAVRRKGWDIVNIPDVAGLLDVLVAVNFGLFVGPVRERAGMGPHCDFGGHMDQLKVSGHCLEILARFTAFNLNFEKSVIVSSSIALLKTNGSKFLVSRIIWRSDVMGHQDSVSNQMPQTNNIANLDTLSLSAGKRF